MKIIKKILIGLAIFFVLIVAAAFILPVVFKDDIKKALDEQIAKSVNADVVFNVDNFNLSFFRHFPSVTASVDTLGVFNREPFAGEHLFVVDRFEVEINLKDVLFGNQLRVKGITLLNPQINVTVLKDGRANYDIAVPTSDTVQSTEPSKFSFGIDHWEVVNGSLVYDDQSMPFYMSLKGLNHSGSGDFNEKLFDLTTSSHADLVTVAYGGTEYISNKRADIEAVIGISEEFSRYTFKENKARLNDFAMSFDGWFKMNADSYEMDITYKTQENSFKSLLSLVPGIYTQSFANLETRGELAFSGLVKGTFSDKQMPAFGVDLKVKDGFFQYPGLPTAVSNINMDMVVDNKDGVIEHTVVDLKRMHLDFGSNPVDAALKVENLKDYRMAASVAARLDLGELTKMFPIDSPELKGIFTVKAQAQGVYDSIRHLIPTVDVAMTLADGYVKSGQFPIPLEDLHFNATVKNASSKMAETVISVPDFSMLMGGDQFTASLLLQNLDDYTWDLKAKGGVDLEKITKIFPLTDMTVAGLVKADLETKGKFSDVKASRYDKLPTSGTAMLSNFKLNMKGQPPVAIGSAQLSFDPRKIELKQLDGTVGRTDYRVTGVVSNYIGYALGHNEVIQGVVTFNSTTVDLNEFMTSSTESTTDTTSLSVIPIPANVDFTLKSAIGTVKMMDYVLTNVAGDIIVRNSTADLHDVKFNMMGGSFGVNGTYNTKDIKHPVYNMGLKIDNLSIKEAASSFTMVKTYAPFAGMMSGSFSTDFKVGGELKQNMMPNMSTVNGAGLVKIAQAALQGSKLVSGITSLTKLSNSDQVSMKDVLMSATINNGRLSVKPFDVKMGNYATTISGSSGLDGTLDYSMKMMVPAGKLGSQLQGFVNPGTTTNPNSEIPLNIGLGGTYKDPKPKLVSTEQKQQVKQAVTNVVEEKGKEKLKEVVKGTEAENVVNNLLGNKKDSVKKDSVKANPVQNVLQNKLQNLLKKKK
ncbi:MAG: AsmA-like C-terminal region-containing protein [Cyclobacteriaceae bacterium]